MINTVHIPKMEFDEIMYKAWSDSGGIPLAESIGKIVYLQEALKNRGLIFMQFDGFFSKEMIAGINRTQKYDQNTDSYIFTQELNDDEFNYLQPCRTPSNSPS